MRVLGDGGPGRPPWALVLWRDGLLHRLPAQLDHAIVGMSFDPDTGRTSQVMRDVSSTLIPTGACPVPLAQHRRLLEHLATLHATFWDFPEAPELMPMASRYTFADPGHAGRANAGYDDVIPSLFGPGWAAVAELEPAAAQVAAALTADPGPLVEALAGTPATLVHGDWKFGNLGSHPDGRTVLLDWGWPGRAGPLVDLAWYLAVNCDRLPESKESTIAAYRRALADRGAATDGWWERQLELALLGGYLQLGWSKAGDPAELAWWARRAVRTAERL
jgi:aminoglycoside phosphotransferase (APT) family kinase protein